MIKTITNRLFLLVTMLLLSTVNALAQDVAEIDGTKYATLDEAIAKVQDDQTITLLADCETGSRYINTAALKIAKKGTTLDLNGKTLTVTNNFSFCVTADNVTVKNGTIVSGENPKKDTKLNSYILVIGGVDKEATISGVTVENVRTEGGISVGGSSDSEVKGIAKNTVIKDCEVLSGDYYAVCSQNKSTVTINGGEYTANTKSKGSGVLQASFKGDDGPEGKISVVDGTFTGAIAADNQNLIRISGGTFSVDPTAFVAEGCETDDYGDIWIVTGPVMILNSAYYATVEEAFAAVKDGQTISLNEDITLSEGEALNLELAGKTVIFDLGSYTLEGRVNLKSGTLTVEGNGKVANPNGQALNVYGSATAGAKNYSVLNVNCAVQAGYGVCMFGPTVSSKAGYGAVVNILPAANLDCTGEGTIFVSGNLGNNIAGDMNNVINIEGQVYGPNSVGVALNGNATVNVKEGAMITGNTAIAIKRGVLNVIDGTVWGEGDENLNPSANNNGVELTGAAISMTDTYNNYGSMAVNISGGDIISDKSVALFKKEGTYTNAATFAVSGGTFSSAVPEEFCAEGYVPTALGNNQYGVKQAEPVAKIGDVEYTTLAKAIAAANATGNVTINLLRDYDFEANEPGYGYGSFLAEGESTTRNNMLVFSANNITFDLGGHTISNLFNNTFNVTGSNVTFQNGGMRVGQLYYSSADGKTIYTSENDKTCSYIVYVTNATNFTVNSLTTYGGINVSASTATINDLSFSGTKFYAVCSQSNSTVTLNGGTYTKAITGAAGYMFWVEAGSVMNIVGGTYTKGSLKNFRNGINPVITGGTFDFDPTNFGVADGYEAVDNNNGTWTVEAKEFTITTFKDNDLNSVFVDKVAGESVYPSVTVEAKTGQTVTLIIAPTPGYSLKSLSLNSGAQLKAVESDKNQRTFVMPAANVTISAEFVLNETESVKTIEEATISDEGKATITNVEIAQNGVKNVTVSAAIGSAEVTEIAEGAFASLPNTVQTIDLSSTLVALKGKRSENLVLKDIPATALVYLPSSSSEVTGTNVVIKAENSDNYTCVHFQMDDMNDYSIPTSFTATTATLNRPFSSKTHCTICLPYDVPASDIPGSIYRYTGFDSAAAAPAIEMTEDNDGLDANVPYIFVPSGNSQSISTSSPSGTIQVSMSVAPQESTDGFTFKGVFEEKHFTEDEYYAGIYGYAGVDTETTTTGYFYKLGLQAWVPAMRAYLVANSVAGAPSINGAQAAPALPSKIKVILKSATGETTDILHFDMETAEDDAPVYNLSGQRVNNATKGIYIKNGKKVVIK